MAAKIPPLMAGSKGKQSTQQKVKVGILTVSDTCFKGTATDRSGPNLKKLIEEKHVFPGVVELEETVPDDLEIIKGKLINWSDERSMELILTTGGTGCDPRDVTPEATRAVWDKETLGITIAMLKGSLSVTPLAMLSRQVSGIRGKTLIINLPGSFKASQECLSYVVMGITHAVDLLNSDRKKIKETHDKLQGETSAKVNGDVAPTGKGDADKHHNDSDGRERVSPYPMIPVKEALAKVLSEAPVLATESIGLKYALGYYLAEDVIAKDPQPPFEASIKDGYAVIAADGAGDRNVIGDALPGAICTLDTLTPGNCIKISTGAPIPAGADAVVQVEDTILLEQSEDKTKEIKITVKKFVTVGQDIRPIGSEIKLAEKILSIGTRLGPAELGLIASVGVNKVLCHKRPIVGVLSTGNEVVEPGEDLPKGKIYDSNRTTLLAILKDQNVPHMDLGIAKDSPEALQKAFQLAMTKCNVVITTGGVSMGEQDLVKKVLEEDVKATLHFGRVNMKPGKPTSFLTAGQNDQKFLFFGLPGNPVSAAVTAHIFVTPALRKMAGSLEPDHTVVRAKLSSNINLPKDKRPEYHRAVVTWKSGNIPTAESTGSQLSSRLLSMKSANALLLLNPRDTSYIKRGIVVDAIITGNI